MLGVWVEPDVKPPCSNLAGAYGSGHFLFCLSQPFRMPAGGTRRGYPGPHGVARANPLPMTLQFDRPRCSRVRQIAPE
jgi:hypothetical protein